MTKLRPDLPPLPNSIAKLPLDERGYPVPWFVAIIDGKPEFRVADGKKFARAIRDKLCWVCGDKIDDERYAFVLGPMCIVNRTTAEPPCHAECAIFSAMACPFLTKPHMVRRENDLPPEGTTEVSGFAIKRNPGATGIWVTRKYSLFGDGDGGVLVRIGAPEYVRWFAEGRKGTRAEVLASMESGLPILMKMAEDQSLDAVRALKQMYEAAMVFVPKE